MKYRVLCYLLLPVTAAFPAAPEVSNIRAEQRAGTKLVDIHYDVIDVENDPLTVAVQISSNAGSNWNIPARTLTGDVNFNVTPGINRHIVWNAGADWNRNYTTQGKVRILADDAATTPPVATMAFVPAGFSIPGANIYFNPLDVYTSAFFIDKTEVSKALWDTVYNWAIANGYEFDNAGAATASDHPIVSINWHDAVKWCNARSEKEGLTPSYYTDAGKTTVYRTGLVALDNNWADWDANGYRLPTRAEWVKAYWGGNEGSNFFPWPSSGGSYGDHLHGSFGNYQDNGDPYDQSISVNSIQTTPTGYFNGAQTPQGADMSNGFGLYDMFGNVSEWMWDRELTNWYQNDESRDDNSKGPNIGTGRLRCVSGVSWSSRDSNGYLRDNKPSFYIWSGSYGVEQNGFYWDDTFTSRALGFRTVRTH